MKSMVMVMVTVMVMARPNPIVESFLYIATTTRENYVQKILIETF